MWQWLAVGDGSMRSLDAAISCPCPRKVALHDGCLPAPGGDAVGHVGEVRH